MKKYFYRLLPICLFILVMTGCNDTETVISIGEAGIWWPKSVLKVLLSEIM